MLRDDKYFLESEKEAYSSREETEKADEHIIIEETGQSSQPEAEKPEITIIPAQNFHITDEHLGEGSPKQKFHANMDAIRTLRLLEEENMKVYEAAEALGFESAFYFSKVFKRVEGVSPTEYVNNKFS